jgi:hypothetical protein
MYADRMCLCALAYSLCRTIRSRAKRRYILAEIAIWLPGFGSFSLCDVVGW